MTRESWLHPKHLSRSLKDEKARPSFEGKRKKVTIEFESPSGATEFECSIDNRSYKACESPLRRSFRLGEHIVRVRAVNELGTADQTPAKSKFRVKGEVSWS